MKKLLSILLCLAMVMALAASAFAGAADTLAPGAENDTSSSLVPGAGNNDAEGDTSSSLVPGAGNNNAETPNENESETPEVEMFTLTVNGKDLTIPMANVAIDKELNGVGDYGLIIYTPAYTGAGVSNGWGEAIVVKDGKVVRAYDGMNGKYFDADHPYPDGLKDPAYCDAAKYAAQAFASRQEGEYVVIAPNSTAANTMFNGSGTRNFLNSNGRIPGTVVTGLPEVKDENSGSMEVKVTDTYNFVDEYTFTAPVSGTYTFAVPAGLAWMSKTQQELGWDGRPEIDFYSESANPTVVVDLAANENYVFFVGSVEKGTFEITWTVVPGEVEGGEGEGEGSDTPAVDPTKLNGKWEASFFSTYFWYLTFENGTLVINDTTNGITGADLSGTYTYTVVEGLPVLNNNTTITFIKDAGGNMIMVVNGKTNLAMTKTENGAAEEEIIPSVNLGDNSVSVPADKAVTGTKVNFSSENGGTYVLTATDANSWISLDGGYNWLQAGEKKEFTLAAGQTISILVGASNEAADTIEFSITEKTGEDEEKPAGPIDIWGVDQLPELGGSLTPNTTQQFKFWGPLPNGTLTINGRDMWVMYNGVRYNPSRGVVSIPVKETDVNEEGYALIEICAGPVAVTYTFGFSYAPGTGENPEKLNDLHKVELNLDADGHWYQFTATETGNLVIYLNQGLEGSIVDILLENKNNEDWNTNSASLVTYDDDLKPIVGKNVTLAVNKGDTILIYIYELADEPKGGKVIFSNREALVADGSQKDPITMEVGKTYDFIVPANKISDGLFYTFTATENGTLTITILNWTSDISLLISGGPANKGNGVYTMEVEAGRTYSINPWSMQNKDFDLDLAVTFQNAASKPGASQDNPIDLDETKPDLTLSFGSTDTYFAWTATADGTVTIALDKNEWLQGTSITVNGTAMSAYGMRTVTVEVKAGDVVMIVAKDMSGGDDTIDLDVTFAEAPKVDPAVENVIKLIDAIGTVTLDSEAAIKAAREAMDALDMNQKMEVTNSMTLADAEAKLLQLKQEAAQAAADKAEAEKVMALIDKIGTVDANSKPAIEAARAAYEALTDAQKALVTNLETLERAEKAFEGIKPEGDNAVIFFAMMAMAATGLVVLVSKKRAF